ncbi:MAG: hypothetical protein ACT4QF_05810 [Sporichthyaceae bacterium]
MSTPNRRTTVLATALILGVAGVGALAVAPGAVAAIASGEATSEKNGACGEARYDAEVDREGKSLETSFEIDDAKPAQRWQISLSHNGEKYFDRELTTDREGEIDVEQLRPDAAGVDEFVMSAKRIDGPGDCSVTLTR